MGFSYEEVHVTEKPCTVCRQKFLSHPCELRSMCLDCQRKAADLLKATREANEK